MTLQEFDAGLLQYFGIHRSRPYLCQVSLMMGKIRVDLLALDRWLEQKHGLYNEEREISMSMLIIEQYGQAAHDWTRRAMGIDEPH